MLCICLTKLYISLYIIDMDQNKGTDAYPEKIVPLSSISDDSDQNSFV